MYLNIHIVKINMFQNISAFIWFTVSYACNKNETCLEFLERLEHHEMPECRKDRKKVPVYLRQRGITFIRPTVEELELGGERMQISR